MCSRVSARICTRRSSSTPQRCAASVAGRLCRSVHARRSLSTAVPRPTPRVIASSRGKDSLHAGELRIGLPPGPAARTGVALGRVLVIRAVRGEAQVTSASRAASFARSAVMRCSSAAFSSAVSHDTGRSRPGAGRKATSTTTSRKESWRAAAVMTPKLRRGSDNFRASSGNCSSGSM